MGTDRHTNGRTDNWNKRVVLLQQKREKKHADLLFTSEKLYATTPGCPKDNPMEDIFWDIGRGYWNGM